MTLRIKEVLSERGISGTGLSELMEKKGYKLSRVSISNILTDTQSPKVKTLEQIADTLEVPISELFEGFTPEGLEPIYKKNEDGTFIEIGYLKV